MRLDPLRLQQALPTHSASFDEEDLWIVLNRWCKPTCTVGKLGAIMAMRNRCWARGKSATPRRLRRLQQLQVAGYSLLLFASLLSSGFERGEREYFPLPKWRRVAPSHWPSL